MATRLYNPAPRYFNSAGEPLLGGKLYFYVPGESLDAKDTYSDNDLTIPNSNPVILSASGLQPNVFLNGAYRVILTDRNDNEIWDRDNVNSISFPFAEWDATIVYGEGADNIVTGSDGNYYKSLVADNVGNDPVSSPSDWEEISFIQTDATGGERISEIADITPSNQAMIIGDGDGWTGTTLAALAPNFISGLITSVNATDPLADIDVAAGRRNNSSNTLSLSLASAMTKRLDATWAAGTSQGGRASGVSLSNSTWYHIFVVRVGSAIDVMFDTSVTCANGVANNAVTHFRRIGSILTNGSAQIIKYFQIGDEFYWDVIRQDVLANNPGESAVTATLSVPTGVTSIAKAYRSLTNGSATQNGQLLVTAVRQTDTAPSGAAYNLSTFAQTTDDNTFGTLVYVETNTSAQIRYRITVTSTATTDFTVTVNTSGWVDQRGKYG